MLGISEPALFGVVMRTGMKAIGVMLASSALGGMALSLLRIQANSYGLAVLLSPLMYIYDPYQLTMYVVIGIATFILAFVFDERPGPNRTPLQLDHGQLDGAFPEFGQKTLLGRPGQPIELAHVYVFLASNNASYVTAQIYGVTGGDVIDL